MRAVKFGFGMGFSLGGSSFPFNLGQNIVEQIANGTIGSYSRASDKNAFNQPGVLTTYDPNVWPQEFDPATGESRGWSVWEDRKNVIHRNTALDNTSTWDHLGLNAVATISTGGKFPAAFRLTAGSAGDQVIRQALAGTLYLSSALFKAGSRDIAVIGGTSTVLRYSSFNLTTGQVTVGVGHEGAEMRDVGDGWWLCWAWRGDASNTNLGSPGTRFGFGDANGDMVNDGSLDGETLDIALPMAFDVDYRGNPGPIIITPTDADVSRDDDVATITDLNEIDFNQSAQTFVIETFSPPDDGNFHTFLSINDGTLDNRILVTRAGGSQSECDIRLVDPGGLQETLTNTTMPAAGERVIIVAAWDSGSFLLAVNGTAVEGAITTSLPTFSQATIGARADNGGNWCNEPFRRINPLPRKVSAAEAQQLSTL